MASQREIKGSTLRGLGNLMKLLPTGTVFFYQFVNPLATNYGNCRDRPVYKILSAVFVAVCGFLCLILTFTDSYTDAEGKARYAFLTPWGLRPVPRAYEEIARAPRYHLRLGDVLHAFLAVVVFAVVVVLDANTVRCFYPGLEESQKKLISVLPVVVGFVSSAALAVSIPSRSGIGYPSNLQSQDA